MPDFIGGGGGNADVFPGFGCQNPTGAEAKQPGITEDGLDMGRQFAGVDQFPGNVAGGPMAALGIGKGVLDGMQLGAGELVGMPAAA